ncbi:MAG: hypothetical protein RL266_2212, partial [Bacteroidota bacterium]
AECFLVIGHGHRAIEKPDADGNVDGNKEKQEDVAFFHGQIQNNCNNLSNAVFTRTSPKRPK